jgi:hypothetical protein
MKVVIYSRVLLGTLCFLALATSVSAEGRYADSVLNRPLPRDNDERIRECNWIRAEIVKQQNVVTVARTTLTNPLAVAQVQVVAQQNVAALESRAANIQCSAAFSNAPVPNSPSSSFDQCFTRCRQYTDRTKEQCFDACNK